MTLTVETRALADALARATKAVKTRNTIPILDNVMLTQSGEELTITATDKDVRVDVTIACSGKLSPTTAPARRLNDLVRGYPSGSQTTLSLDGEHVVVACGRSRAKLLTLPVEGFPSASSDKFGKPVEIDLRSMVDQVKFAVSTDSTRFYLNGVYLGHRDDMLDVVATDGHRMAILSVAPPSDMDLVGGIILPNDLLSIIPEGLVRVAFAVGKVRIETQGSVISAKLIEGTFPDYMRVIPKGHDVTATLDRDELVQSIARLDNLARDLKSSPANFAIKKDSAVAETKNPQVGTVTEAISCAATGEIVFGLNTSYAKDLFSALPPGKFDAQISAASIVIRSDELTLVQMCMRVAG